MDLELDELEINPFYKALQTNYIDLYERAQQCCYSICVPQTVSLNPHSISTDFVETHILRPSPYFKGQFMSTHSRNCKTLCMNDDWQFLVTNKGFPNESMVKVLSEELAYNKVYKQYRILILEKPLDSKFELKNPVPEEVTSKQLHTHKIDVQECTDFLNSFHEFQQSLQSLDKKIEHFRCHYMVLSDYLDDAVNRLQDISSSTLKDLSKNLKSPRNLDQKFLEVLAGAIESYLMNAVYNKVFTEICHHLNTADQVLLSKCHKLNKVKPEEIGVRKEFSCPLPTAVVELANLGSLRTPRGKLACLKSTVDNITEGITLFIKENQTPQLAGLTNDAEPCITSDDLIPILVMIIAQAKCCHLHSDLYYTENFIWDSTDRDRDDLSYCLVTFKAAVQYMMSTDFSLLKEQSSAPEKEISIEDLIAATSLGVDESNNVESKSSSNIEYDPSGRLKRQLNRISGILEQTTLELGAQRASERRIESIFPERVLKLPALDLSPPKDIESKDDEGDGSQLGDFLSALQDNDLDLTFGKQS